MNLKRELRKIVETMTTADIPAPIMGGAYVSEPIYFTNYDLGAIVTKATDMRLQGKSREEILRWLRDSGLADEEINTILGGID